MRNAGCLSECRLIEQSIVMNVGKLNRGSGTESIKGKKYNSRVLENPQNP